MYHNFDRTFIFYWSHLIKFNEGFDFIDHISIVIPLTNLECIFFRNTRNRFIALNRFYKADTLRCLNFFLFFKYFGLMVLEGSNSRGIEQLNLWLILFLKKVLIIFVMKIAISFIPFKNCTKLWTDYCLIFSIDSTEPNTLDVWTNL